MDLNDFIEHFAEQFDETEKIVFTAENSIIFSSFLLTAETVFKELDEWSSLIALSVMAMADEEYDVQLKGDDILASRTIEDLYNRVALKRA